MECKCCKPTSAPLIPGWCSVTAACSKHWKQQGFAQSPGSMPERRRRMMWGGGGGRLLGSQWSRSSKTSPSRWAPHSISSTIVTWHFFCKLWGPRHQAGMPCARVSWVHASSSVQAAMQRAVAAPAPASAPAKDFEEQGLSRAVLSAGGNEEWGVLRHVPSHE